MRRIILASPKGGAGKTTLCRNLAATAAAEGLRVAIGDLDPQRTLTKWWRRRKSSERPMQHYELSMEDANVLAGDGAVEDCDVFLIDTPPAIEAYPTPLRHLIDAADFIVVPSRPTLDDAESAAPFMQVLRRRKRPAAFVINAVKPRTRVGARICWVLSKFKGLRQMAIFEIPCNFKGLAYPCTNAPSVR